MVAYSGAKQYAITFAFENYMRTKPVLSILKTDVMWFDMEGERNLTAYDVREAIFVIDHKSIRAAIFNCTWSETVKSGTIMRLNETDDIFELSADL